MWILKYTKYTLSLLESTHYGRQRHPIEESYEPCAVEAEDQKGKHSPQSTNLALK